MGKKNRGWVLDYTIYLVVRCLVAMIQTLPLSAGYVLARLLAQIAYWVDRRHRRVALENLHHAFGDRYSLTQRRQLVYAVYEHFARVIVEIAKIPRLLRISHWKKYIRLTQIAPIAQTILNDSRPTLIVTGHFGNWEMAGYLLAAIGVRSYAIARDLDNPYLHNYLKKFREYTGQTILSKTGDFDRIRQVLQERGVLISVADQSAGKRGHFVDFFGRPASTHKAIALLAMQYDARIVIGYARRDRPGFHYTIGCGGTFDPRDYEHLPNGAWQLTQDVMRALEAVIREAPEQYLWLHNRWKHQPPARQHQHQQALTTPQAA